MPNQEPGGTQPKQHSADQLKKIQILPLQQIEYVDCLTAMRHYTEQRNENSRDQLWLVEHPPVFTLGLNGDPAHILNPGEIPVVKTERGGQATYHGPGQLVAYPMLDISRRPYGVRGMVSAIEQAVIDLLGELGLDAHTRDKMPGVYVENAKIAALGLRIKRGCSFHGVSLNIDMDLEPFQRINPCGYENLKVTQISDFTSSPSMPEISCMLAYKLAKHLTPQQR